MSKVIFFLGAGASRDSGAPLINNFIDQAISLAEIKLVDPLDIDIVNFIKTELIRDGSNNHLNPNNIEDLLKYAESKWPHNLEYINAILRVIADTLDASISFPIHDSNLTPSSSSYSFLSRLICRIINAPYSHQVVLMTVNYDVCLDVAVLHSGFRPYYCLNRNRGPNINELSVIKLHGALNWLGCASYGHAYINAKYHVDEFFRAHIRNGMLTLNVSEPVRLNFRKAFQSSRCHICNNPLQSPLIVPPIANKINFHRDMRILWDCAKSNLKDVSYLVVAGYSWSNTDQAVNSLLALALDNTYSSVMIFDPSKDTLLRAKKALKATPDCNRIITYQKSFEEALPIIETSISKSI